MVDPDEISVTELYRLVSVPLCSVYLQREPQGGYQVSALVRRPCVTG